MLIRLVKPFLLKWLEERALRLPSSVRRDIAKRFGVEFQLIESIEVAVRDAILEEIRQHL